MTLSAFGFVTNVKLRRQNQGLLQKNMFYAFHS